MALAPAAEMGLIKSGAPFTPESRRRILDACFAAARAMNEIGMLAARAQGAAVRRLAEHQSYYAGQVSQLCDEYRAAVPVVPLSRCPFTGAEVRHSFDPFGLDGLWWRYDAPVRPPETLPSTYVTLTGAVKRGPCVEYAPFLCVPGPGAPYVLPRLLDSPHVIGVLSAIRTGEHQAYALFYFADAPVTTLAANVWGTNEYLQPDEYGQLHKISVVEREEEYDYDLGPWIERRRLRWIAPGDTSLALCATIQDCPYLGLPGRRSVQHIQRGEVW